MNSADPAMPFPARRGFADIGQDHVVSEPLDLSTARRSPWRDPVLVTATAVLAVTALTALVLTAIVRPEQPQAGSPQAGSPQTGLPQAGSPQTGLPQAGSPQTGPVGWSAPPIRPSIGVATSSPAVGESSAASGASPAPGGAVVVAPPRPSAGAEAPPWASTPESADIVACPPSGVRLRVGEGNAAMGLRVLGLELVNCGTRPYPVRGYPAVRILDAERQPLDLAVFNGRSVITSLPAVDATPQALTLASGESAHCVIVWRTTARDGAYLEVAPLPGQPSQIVDPGHEIDLGDGGRFGVGPWRRATTS
jgi:hypothetical protein